MSIYLSGQKGRSVKPPVQTFVGSNPTVGTINYLEDICHSNLLGDICLRHTNTNYYIKPRVVKN